MSRKKVFDIYYLLLCEGTTEFNLFAYLTKSKFRKLFDNSTIKFSNKIEIVEANISQGKLNGIGSLKSFNNIYKKIKSKYPDQKLFFLLDKDLDHSTKIEKSILSGNDICQFVEYNSEYLLLKYAGKNPKSPTQFNNLGDFRSYSKSEFQKQFKKQASELKDSDFDQIFGNIRNKDIKTNFKELFDTITKPESII